MQNKHKQSNNKKIKQKSNNIINVNSTNYLNSKLYIFILALFLFTTFVIYYLLNGNISTTGVQIFFIAVFIALTSYAIYLFVNKQLKMSTVTIMVIILGITLRVCYMLYTNYDTRQHDVIGSSFGHLEYIRYLAKNWSLPDVGYCQAYHPPLHHLICAVIYSIGKSVGMSEFFSLRLVEMGMVFLSSLTLIYFYKILKELKCPGTVILSGVSIFAFHPTNIYFSVFLNNDGTMLFFYVLTLYFLLKWRNNKTMKNIIWVAISTSLAILTKKPSVLILPIIFIVFLIAFLKNKKNYKLYLDQFIVYLSISVPLSISYQLRNLILFNQGLGYAPGVDFPHYSNSLYNLFYIPVKSLFLHPFTEDPYTGDNQLFSQYLFKSSLFGEWRFPGLEKVASVLVFFAVIVLLISIVSIFIQKKDEIKKNGYIFLLNLILPMLMIFKARIDSPVVCGQNFRYVAPILISLSYFIGIAVYKSENFKYKFLKYFIAAGIVLFCSMSAVFILQIGVPANMPNQ